MSGMRAWSCRLPAISIAASFIVFILLLSGNVKALAPPITHYILFFGNDSSIVSAEGQQEIDAMLFAYRDDPDVVFEIIGHDDTFGPEQESMDISLRRARVVAAILMRRGIPEDRLIVSARGEADPLANTPDDVREPYNQRVEIWPRSN